MIERYFQFLGEDQTKQLLDANEKPLTPSIRVNTLKIGKDTLKKRLGNKGFKLESIDWIHNGFKIRNPPLNLGSRILLTAKLGWLGFFSLLGIRKIIEISRVISTIFIIFDLSIDSHNSLYFF